MPYKYRPAIVGDIDGIGYVALKLAYGSGAFARYPASCPIETITGKMQMMQKSPVKPVHPITRPPTDTGRGKHGDYPGCTTQKAFLRVRISQPSRDRSSPPKKGYIS